VTATVDIGIPTYGRPRYVVEAVESVLAQTLGDWRLTISEDGPATDAVATAIDPYLHDPRIHYTWTEEHVGAARNLTGLVAQGTAPYVALLHDDDRWGSRFLAHRVAFLGEHPECGLVCSGSTVIDGDGRQVRVTPPRVSAPAVRQPAELIAAMVRRNMVPTPTVVVRRAAYDAVGPVFDARFARVYDYEMWLRIALRFPVGYLDDDQAFWRLHGEQSTVAGRRRGDEQLRFLDHVEGLAAAGGAGVMIDPDLLNAVRARRLVSAGLDAVERGEHREAVRRVRQALRADARSAADPRLAAALAAVLAGRRGSRALGAWRSRVRRSGYHLPA
jgi:glycosyltransferase involved in cell wall biosynthesis